MPCGASSRGDRPPGSRSGASVTIRVSPAAASSSRAIDPHRPRMASRGCAPRYPSASFRNGPSMWTPAIRRRASGSAREGARASRQPAAHRLEIVGDDRREERRNAVGFEPFAGAVQVDGGQVVLVEIDAGIAVDLQIEIAAQPAVAAGCPPRPAPPRVESSSFVHGRVRLAVAARTSFDRVRIDRRGARCPTGGGRRSARRQSARR